MEIISSFRLKVVTPQREFFNADVSRVIIRTTEGDVGILKGHASFVAPVGIGAMRITVEGEEKIAAVSGGMIKVDKKNTIILANTCEWAEEIDVDRAHIAKERAEKYIQTPTQRHSVEIAQLKLKRALNRINIANK